MWVVLALTVGVGAFLIARNQAQGPGEATAAPEAGLPDTSDYHSLLVASDDPERIVLGTHAGLFESTDGGRSWSAAGLAGMDAMNLVRSGDQSVWAAGHNVLARSRDGGVTWDSVRPEGLPSLDVHGFARDPNKPDRFYAAVAGRGLYVSRDGGASFRLASEEVGGSVFGLGVTPSGRILAGDVERGLLMSDDEGATWTLVERFAAAGLAINPDDPDVIAAAGQSPLFAGVLVSVNGGATWEQAVSIESGAGPIAWAPSRPDTGYVVGFDKLLYRTDDRGGSWQPVA